MTVIDDDEWMAPPIDHLLDYVPVGARPLFAEQFREMLRWLEREQRNEARWFLLLRAWPVLVTGPILRRSDYARTPLGGSGRELDPAWTCGNPDCDKKIRKDVQERVIAKRISKGDKNTDPPGKYTP